MSKIDRRFDPSRYVPHGGQPVKTFTDGPDNNRIKNAEPGDLLSFGLETGQYETFILLSKEKAGHEGAMRWRLWLGEEGNPSYTISALYAAPPRCGIATLFKRRG